MRSVKLLALLGIVGILGLVHAKPLPPKGDDPTPAFKPITIVSELGANDPKDDKTNNPSRKYPVKFHKDKTYVIELLTKDFDGYLRLLDKQGKKIIEDDTGAEDLNSRLIYTAPDSGEYQIVATSNDDQLGKFTFKVRELKIIGENKTRELGKDGVTINEELSDKDTTDLGPLTKVITLDLKAGQAYIFDVQSENFDCHAYVFDGKGKFLGQNFDKVIAGATANGAHHVVLKSFDGQTGKFELKVRTFSLKGEAKAREIPKDGLSIDGKIGENDKTPVDKLGKVYSVQLKAGQTYTIDLRSQDMDSYLYLFDSKITLLAQDDDSGGDLHSRINFRAPTDGVYHIIATTLGGMETGDYTLSVKKD